MVLTAVPTRMIADLLGSVSIPGFGVSAMAVLTGCWLGALSLVLAAHTRRVVHHPLRGPLLAFAALLLVGLLRAPDWEVGLYGLARTASPLVVLLTVSAVVRGAPARRRFLRVLLWAGAIPVCVSLLYLAAGQMDQTVHDGIHRLLGAYQNVHTHALAMALIAGVASSWVLARDSRETTLAGAVLLCGSGACLALTYVRTAVVVLAITLLVLMVLTRRYRLAAGIAVVGVLGVAMLPTWSERFEDLWMLLTLTPPEDGWGTLGRHRPAIWARSLSAFGTQGTDVWLLGNGLGGHLTFWKPRDPHNEYLALLYQLGPLGPVLYLWLLGRGARHALHNLRAGPDAFSRTFAAYTLAVVVAAVVGNAISNTFVARLTPAWWLWALIGLAVGQESTSKVVRTPADEERSPSTTRVQVGTSTP
ncbi:MAG: O-antigen ligase family protein [Deltaproteobacteria bacterium]|nr:O-antigen ligase family protein [Deltaproteobacteria bacterium]